MIEPISEEQFISEIVTIVEDSSFDGCNILHAEVMAEELYQRIKEGNND